MRRRKRVALQRGKNADSIERAIRRRCNSGDGAEGREEVQIADRLVITPRAAAAHVEHILDKLGAGSRTQIGVWIAERGLLTTRTA